MSLLDTIKGLLCKLMGDKPESEQENKAPEVVTPTAKVKPEPVAEPKPEPIVKQKPKPAPKAKKEPTPAKVETKKVASLPVPEDSALRRHFLSALKIEVETSMGARPTDSALKRHYDAAVQAELDNLLG